MAEARTAPSADGKACSGAACLREFEAWGFEFACLTGEAHKIGSTFATLAALALTVSLVLLSFAVPSEAAACSKSSPGTVPAAPSGGGGGKCPVNALKLGVCADVLGGLVSLLVGDSPAAASSGSGKKKPCCELLAGLADMDAAVCLCTAVKARVLGVVDLDLPVQLRLLVNRCGKKIPDGFQCSS